MNDLHLCLYKHHYFLFFTLNQSLSGPVRKNRSLLSSSNQHLAGMMRQGYYYPHVPYPYPPGYYGHHRHYIYDNDNNIVERNPYPFDGPYLDRRMVEPSHDVGAHRVGYDRHGRLRPYPYYDSRYWFHGRLDPYTSYRAYYETPLLAFPQPPPRPQTHPFYTPESICSIM